MSVIAVASCRNDGVPATPAATPAGESPATADQQCLPAMICDQWAGCALVTKDAQDRWSVVSADRANPGEVVRVENVCTTGVSCVAARAFPRDVDCPPVEIPPVISPPDYTCTLDAGSCRVARRR